MSPPPSREYVAQVWVGFSVDDVVTLRIELKADGTGSGVLLSGDKTRRFQVISWNLNDDALDIAIHFADAEISASRLSGKFKTHLIAYNTAMLPHPENVYDGHLPGRLELSFGAGGIRFGLWPESELQHRLQRARSEARHR
jgi:hypothetical protein